LAREFSVRKTDLWKCAKLTPGGFVRPVAAHGGLRLGRSGGAGWATHSALPPLNGADFKHRGSFAASCSFAHCGHGVLGQAKVRVSARSRKHDLLIPKLRVPGSVIFCLRCRPIA